MSVDDAFRRGAAPTKGTKIPAEDLKIIEIYECQERSFIVGGKWKPRIKSSWTDADGARCASTEDFVPPGPHWKWNSNWCLDSQGVGSKDEQGWEYATAYNKFSPHRVPRTEGLKDFVRRRKWTRQMLLVRPKDNETKLSEFQSNLQKLQSARGEVQKMALFMSEQQQMNPTATTGSGGSKAPDWAPVLDYMNKTLNGQKVIKARIDKFLEETKGDHTWKRRGQKLQSDLAVESAALSKIGRDVEKWKAQAHRPSAIQENAAPLPLQRMESVRRRSGLQATGGGGGIYNPEAVMELERSYADDGPDGAYVSREKHAALVRSRLVSVDQGVIQLEIAQENSKRIETVHSSVTELNKIFRDVEELVNDQQEGIDRIEDQVNAANMRVKEGIVDLDESIRHQKKTCCVS
mmetsp:Transcript_46923/g.63850  ORF Transcript_46923/g.63850 Transcript_46923/m.63850 type:complete len:406 (-) Transcript_46923:221-1438(-)|eukprot:CAMPEP_0185761966 /NCGR_PEP_ID=MMETSP1174-20130828/20919_1 /TAXON_ID=35687 /ORGANISM="Dictyocha speculum, Strain CCMP1381" /LENGTH=405 /DNA_ID=CAMNT_0028443419 /DNA_START=94 /DNA_END=1311 /DNA_ORIENTATION=-